MRRWSEVDQCCLLLNFMPPGNDVGGRLVLQSLQLFAMG